MAKRSYKEKLPNGQGKELEPKNHWENKAKKKNPFVERDENRRLSGSKLDHYFPDQHGLGSPSDYDDFGEDSFP